MVPYVQENEKSIFLKTAYPPIIDAAAAISMGVGEGAAIKLSIKKSADLNKNRHELKNLLEMENKYKLAVNKIKKNQVERFNRTKA